MLQQAAAAANRKRRVHVLGLMLYSALSSNQLKPYCWFAVTPPPQTLPPPARHQHSRQRRISLIRDVISSEE
jgi:hypothetical protein